MKMGAYWSTENDRISELESRIRVLESQLHGPIIPVAPIIKPETRPIIRPAWHATLMKELAKRRKSIE